jgi:hypothetical protein
MTKHSDQAGGGSRPSSVPLRSDRDPSTSASESGTGTTPSPSSQGSPSTPASRPTQPSPASQRGPSYGGATHTGSTPATHTGSTNPAGQASQAAQGGGQASQAAQGMADQAREQAKTLAAEAKNLASEATEQTAELAGRATQQVNTLMTDQKRRAAERLGTLAGALREAGRKLGNDELGGRVGQYAQRAADQVDSMSSYVRTAELQSFVRDAGQFARRRPEVFIGGAFLTGLLAARFLKASSSHSKASSSHPRQYETHAGLPARQPETPSRPYMGGR